MSILVNMEMPKDCAHCSFHGFGGMMHERILCMLTGTNDYINQQSKLEDCPLTEIPEPHGRLVDADALKMNSQADEFYIFEYVDVEDIDKAPTIIPKSEEVTDG